MALYLLMLWRPLCYIYFMFFILRYEDHWRLVTLQVDMLFHNYSFNDLFVFRKVNGNFNFPSYLGIGWKQTTTLKLCIRMLWGIISFHYIIHGYAEQHIVWMITWRLVCHFGWSSCSIAKYTLELSFTVEMSQAQLSCICTRCWFFSWSSCSQHLNCWFNLQLHSSIWITWFSQCSHQLLPGCSFWVS